MQLFLQKLIWLPRLLSQYTSLHTVTPPYPQYATYVPSVKKEAAKNLKEGRDEKELKLKWAAKAGVVLVLMRIRF